jgi:hypothetical protein
MLQALLRAKLVSCSNEISVPVTKPRQYVNISINITSGRTNGLLTASDAVFVSLTHRLAINTTTADLRVFYLLVRFTQDAMNKVL